MERLSMVEAKRDLSRVVNKAAFGREPVVITSRGRPKAVVISHEEFLRLTGTAAPKVIRLRGLWRGTPEISEQDLRAVRSQVWGRLTRR